MLRLARLSRSDPAVAPTFAVRRHATKSGKGRVRRSKGGGDGEGATLLDVDVSGPLKGLRVLDLSRILAGPYASMVLGDMGAEVIKVEQPGCGDDTRTWGPPFVRPKTSGAAPESSYFLAVNRNKLGMTVDLKHPEGKRIIQQLAMQADVLLENFPPHKMDSYGLGYADLRVLNPRLIYCSITAFGPDGPYRDRRGYDVVVSAIGGLMGITGDGDGPPVKCGVAVTDVVTGLFASNSILAAVHARQSTGCGQKIDTSLLETQVATLINIGSNYLTAGVEARRWGSAHASIVPYQAFATKDGYYTVGALNDAQFGKLCALLQCQHLVSDRRFSRNKDRVENRSVLIPLLEEIFALKTSNEWQLLFADHDLPNGPINNMKQVFSDRQVQHRRMVERVRHPTLGVLRTAGIPTKMSDTPPSVRLAPPVLGQHTDRILRDRLGYTDQQIASLRRAKVI